MTTHSGEMVFMMGLPAAGKTTVAADMFPSHTHIDADAIKATHPDYDPRNAQDVHEWSMEIAYRMFDDALASHAGLWLIDGTGTNAENMVRRMTRAHDAGFRVQLVYVKCSLETSLRRAALRERVVPEFVIREKAASVATAFELIAPYADDVTVIDNDN